MPLHLFFINADMKEELATGVLFGVIGFAFGFTLELSGFGDSRKLAAQFYFTELTVLKVMFTAIVTAMLGMVIVSVAGETEALNFELYRRMAWDNYKAQTGAAWMSRLYVDYWRYTGNREFLRRRALPFLHLARAGVRRPAGRQREGGLGAPLPGRGLRRRRAGDRLHARAHRDPVRGRAGPGGQGRARARPDRPRMEPVRVSTRPSVSR